MVVAGAGPLVGRSAEADALRQLLARVGSGTGEVAFVEGEPGIGKTRLLVEAMTLADELGFQVFAGAAEELAVNRPFGPLVDALELERDASDPARREIAHLLRGNAVHDDGSVLLNAVPDLQFRVVEDVIELVEGLTSSAPVLLVIDDLQWADQGTLLTILGLGRRLGSVSIAVLGAYRPAPRHPDLDRVLASLSRAVHVTLSPLAADEVAELVEQVLAAPPGARLLAEVAGGGGNPLYVTELVRALLDEGDLDWTRASVELRGGELPRNLRLTIVRRLSFLAEPTLALLRVAAVLGRTFSMAELSAVLDRTTVQLLPDVQEAMRAGVLGEVGDRLTFRHDLIREVVYQELPLPVRLQLHREAGYALANLGTPVEVVARHLGLAAEPGDFEAVHWLTHAAAEVGETAPAVGIDLLERALELTPPGPEVARLRAERARLLVWAGRMAEGEAEARALLETDDADTVALDLRAGLALALLLQGRIAESVTELEALTQIDEVPDDLRAHLLAEAALGRLLTGDRASAVRDSNAALEASLAHGDELTCSLSLSTLAWARHDEGNVTEALELAQGAVAHAEQAGPDVVARYGAHYFLGSVLTMADRYDEARQAFVTGRAAAEAAGAITVGTIYHVGIGMLGFATGAWDDAAAELEAGIALAEERGSMLAVTWHWSVLAQIAVHRGEFDRAREMLDSAEAEMLRVGPQVGVDWMMWSRALTVEPDDASQAFALLCNCWDLYAALGVLQTTQTIGPDLTRLAITLKDEDRAAATAARVEAVAETLGTTSARVAALRCRAWLDGDVNNALLARDAARTGVRPLDVALTSEELGLRLRDAGRKSEAAEPLDDALQVFEQLGAAADAARVVAALNSVGSRRRTRAAPRPAYGWESLTKSERAVIDLVARGLTNRQIALQLSVSRRTVETHLSHVFGKLGIASRVELATAATRNT